MHRSSRDVLVEACVTSRAEAEASARAGVHRLELCVDLEVGGLTPPSDLVEEVVAAVDVPVFAMVRPRAGDFRPRLGEVDAMLRSVENLRRAGAAGFVVGLLDRGGEVHGPATADVVVAAAGLPVTFHRAFDEVPDPQAALESLVNVGVARVLTGGGPGRAWDGRDVLRRLVARGGDRIAVLAGGGVRGDHVAELVRVTGTREVHVRAAGIPGVMEALRRDA